MCKMCTKCLMQCLEDKNHSTRLTIIILPINTLYTKDPVNCFFINEYTAKGYINFICSWAL